MTTFGWKRKLGSNVCKETTTKFTSQELDKKREDKTNDHDWESCFKRRKIILLENAGKESLKLKEEGSKLAENGRYREALRKLETATQFNPQDPKLHEMKAQVLMQLNKFFPAINASEKAIQLDPQWWIGYQTLGRAQLGIGEIKMAIISFSKALHMNPANEELWENDLRYSMKMLAEGNRLSKIETFCKENSEYKDSKIVFDEQGIVQNVTDNTGGVNEMDNENIVQCRL